MGLDIRTLTTLWSRKQLDDTNHNFKQLKDNIGTVDENAVGSEQLQENSVGTVELKDKAVTGDKISDGEITSEKIGNGEVKNNNIEFNSITTNKIDFEDNSVFSGIDCVLSTINSTTGILSPSTTTMATNSFVEVKKGDYVELLDKNFLYCPFLYNSKGQYIKSANNWLNSRYIFDGDYLVRFNCKTVDTSPSIVNNLKSINKILSIPNQSKKIITDKNQMADKTIEKNHLNGEVSSFIDDNSLNGATIIDQSLPVSKINMDNSVLSGMTCRIGGIDGNSGNYNSHTARISTEWSVEASKGDTIELIDSRFEYCPFFYNLDDTYINSVGAWLNSTYTITSNCKLKISVRLLNDSTDISQELNNIFKIIRLPESEKGFITKGSQIEKGIIEKEHLNFDITDGIKNKIIDLIIFMGQSNMAGRGIALLCPAILEGAGHEYRAISQPNKLVDIVEPFGVNENKVGGINEPGMKTGSLVSAFVNSCYSLTKVPIVAVSAAKGGSAIEEWQPRGALLKDAIERFKSAESYLLAEGYTIRSKNVLWLQGETDGERGTTEADYKTKLKNTFDELKSNGIENCFVIRIGDHSTNSNLMTNIKKAQTNFCKIEKDAILVSTVLDKMSAEGKMKDTLHFTQEALNYCGAEAGKNVAFYLNNKKEPAIYDYTNDNLYYSYK